MTVYNYSADILKDCNDLLETGSDMDEDFSDSELMNDADLLNELSSLHGGESNSKSQEPKKTENKPKREVIGDAPRVGNDSINVKKDIVLEPPMHRKTREMEELNSKQQLVQLNSKTPLDPKVVHQEVNSIEKPVREKPSTPSQPRSKSESLTKKPKSEEENLDEDFVMVPSPKKHVENEENVKRDKKLNILKEILTQQIQNSKQKEADLKRIDRKRSSEYRRLRMQSEEDLRLILLALATPTMPIPEYKVEIVTHEEEIINHHLSAYEMEVEVIRVEDIRPLSVKETGCDSYVTCTFPFPDSHHQVFKTPSVRHTFSPVFEHKGKFRIEREKRMEKVFKKKKLLFEVIKPPSWFLGSSTLIGRAEVPINILLNECDMYYSGDIVLDKKTAGKIHINVKVKTPLLGKVVEKHNEKRLHILRSGTVLSVEQPTKPSPTPSPTIPIPVQDSKPVVKGPELLKEGLDIDGIISHDVLVYEKEKATRLMVDARRRKDRDIIDDLASLIQVLDLKIQVMIIQCQNGQITPDSYSEAIKRKILEEKQLALRFKKAGNIDKAKETMIRVKIMEKEISGS